MNKGTKKKSQLEIKHMYQCSNNDMSNNSFRMNEVIEYISDTINDEREKLWN